ncbi:hypothetical protein CPB85DRAFT_1443602 [Mucidula mucida]|nr:hypothetical protein CPB85DRAFT_1443602 [Mucidula mucida]
MARRTAIITRSTQRLVGRSCALRLAEDGCDVAICDDSSKQSELLELKREIESKGVKCCSYICDQLNEEDVKNLIGNVVEDLGGVDIASLHQYMPFVYGLTRFIVSATSTLASMSVTDFDKYMTARPRSLLLLLKYTSAQMIKQDRGGRVIGLTNMSALQALLPRLSAYTAACFAIRGLMQTAALELGGTSTAESAIAVLGSQPGWDLQEMQKAISDRTPLPKNAATSQDIALVVGMLASKESDFMTGQTILINGGMMMN